jgi:S-formylglutathione hydrolase FrmB
MENLGIANYTYFEEPGVHNWEFWDRNIARALNFFKSL